MNENDLRPGVDRQTGQPAFDVISDDQNVGFQVTGGTDASGNALDILSTQAVVIRYTGGMSDLIVSQMENSPLLIAGGVLVVDDTFVMMPKSEADPFKVSDYFMRVVARLERRRANLGAAAIHSS